MIAGKDHTSKLHLTARYNQRYQHEKTDAPDTRRRLDATPSSSPSAADLKTWNEGQLAKHNELRAKHKDTPSLVLDDDLIKEAQAWSESQLKNAKMEHATRDALGTQGENLAYAMSSSNDFRVNFDTTPTDRWYSEIKDYDFSNPGFKQKGVVGHFTQVVWKSTTKLGCGTASDGPNVYVTCRYDPGGNMMGAFADNVQPLLGGASTTGGSGDTTTTDGSTDSGSQTTTDGGSTTSAPQKKTAPKQTHSSDEEEFDSKSGTNTPVKGHTPASAKECPSGYGSASVFKNKFQSETCISCNQIYNEAKGEEYDIFVAHQLCPNIEMQSTFTVIMVILIALVVVGVAGGFALGMKNAPKAPDYKEQNTDTQKPTTTNQMNDSVQKDPNQIVD